MKYNGEKANGYLKPNYSYFLLQGIFSTQGSYPSLLHCKCIIYPLGSPRGTMKVKVKLLSCVWLFATPWTVACQAPLSMVFSRQEYWSGLPFSSPGDLPDPGIEPRSPVLQADSLPSELPGKSEETLSISSVSSVAQSCPTFCDPMNRSTPGFPVHHQLPEFTQTHVHRVRDAIQPSHPMSSPFPPAPNPSQHQSLFQWVNS